jgi:hypothetical protein
MSVPDDEVRVLGRADELVPTTRPARVTGTDTAADAVVNPPRTGIAHLAGAVRDATSHTLRTFCTPAGVRGMAVETAWCAARVASYPLGLLREQIRTDGTTPTHYRTDALSPTQRGVVASDMAATGTPILLVHGLMDNRSSFMVFRRALRKRGFGVLHAVNYSVLTTDIRAAAAELSAHVNRLREQTGADQVHIVGHSLGGLIARYYVQCLGGDRAVHTVVTLGTPHGGSTTAYLLPTPLTRQLIPGSDLLTELANPAPHCRTRFMVVWSRMDQLIVPQGNARLKHPDLVVDTLELTDVGHLSLSMHPSAVRWVASSLARLEHEQPLALMS